MVSAGPPPNQQNGGPDYVEGRLLDGFLMLAAGGSSTPDDVVSVNLSSLQIVDVADEDLSYFAYLDRLDVSDNQLSYEHVLRQLARLPRLGALTLACNAISSVNVPAGSLRHLHSLDLSYNELHGDVLGQLAALPSLTRLDLSSNCISSVPPEEELYGFRALEELVLDANDLVQFIQWRALDALPQLRRLSLASNRVKRLKDDAPDVAGGDSASYFPLLEELDLSSNEIASCKCLSALRLFQALRTVNLKDNPCSQGQSAREEMVAGIKILCQASKPWYLQGSGCFQKRTKPAEPRLKLNRRRMRRVNALHQLGAGRRPRSVPQVGVLDEETNRLLVGFWGSEAGAQRSVGLASTVPSSPPAGAEILDDDLSEGELDQILRERRAKIDSEFNAPREGAPSFMRQAPFPADEAAAPPLGLSSRPEEDSTPMSPSSPKRTSSSMFLTGLGEESGEPAASAPRFVKPAVSVPVLPQSSTLPPVLAGAGTGSVILPPIVTGTRNSAGGVSPLDPATIGKPRMVVPDVGVREAMRALRAAAMSEYAVAA